jgi:ankyrin repeat protein
MELLHESGELIAQRYRIVGTLGQGGSGTTYQAEDSQTSQPVALKALSLHRMSDWKMMELFEREAHVLAQLNHPAIPRYLEYFHVDTSQDRFFYIAQQLAPGQSLAALVESGWHATEKEVRHLAIQILEILVYLHELAPPVIHRDIKPQNIIRRDDGQVFLVDFGAVQDTYYSTFMRGSTVVGTYGYMAPEQFRGQAVPVTDLYGLGATLLFLLTHRSPADLPQDRLKIDFRSRVQISADFADWLEKMLEPDVEERFSSAKDALAVLRGKRRVAGKLPVSRRGLVGVGLAGVVAIAGLNYFKYPILNSLGFAPTALYEAAEQGNINTVKHYLEQGVNPNVKSYGGYTPLHLALQKNRQDVTRLLISKGANVNAKSEYGETPLHSAANNSDMAQLLITKGADVKAKNNSGDTPLHLALQHNNQNVAQLLITKGADVKAKNSSGDTPLYLALRNNQKDLVQLLIAKGADINTVNNSKETPLQLALRNNWKDKDVVRLLVSKGADVNANPNSSPTPLYFALLNNNTDIAQLLIANGADINMPCKFRGDIETPLQLALQISSKDMVKLMLAKGGDVNAKDEFGDTMLHRVVRRKNKDMVQLLLAKGADVNAKNQSGLTPLHSAVLGFNNRWYGTEAVVEFDKSKDIVQLLLANGADINAKDNRGKTPLDEVRRNKHYQELAELLKPYDHTK